MFNKTSQNVLKSQIFTWLKLEENYRLNTNFCSKQRNFKRKQDFNMYSFAMNLTAAYLND